MSQIRRKSSMTVRSQNDRGLTRSASVATSWSLPIAVRIEGFIFIFDFAFWFDRNKVGALLRTSTITVIYSSLKFNWFRLIQQWRFVLKYTIKDFLFILIMGFKMQPEIINGIDIGAIKVHCSFLFYSSTVEVPLHMQLNFYIVTKLALLWPLVWRHIWPTGFICSAEFSTRYFWFNRMVSLRENQALIINSCKEKYKFIKHFNPKKKLVLSGVSALFTCCGAPSTSFFLGLTMFIIIAFIECEGKMCCDFWLNNVLAVK